MEACPNCRCLSRDGEEKLANNEAMQAWFLDGQGIPPEANKDGRYHRYDLYRQIEEEGLLDTYRRFVKDTLDGMTDSERIFQGYTPSGNRRYIPHTLDNVVKLLKKDLRGGEGFHYGVGSIRSQLTPQFKSIETIRKAKDRLVSAEQFDALKKEIDAEFSSVSANISPHIASNTAAAIFEDAITHKSATWRTL